MHIQHMRGGGHRAGVIDFSLAKKEQVSLLRPRYNQSYLTYGMSCLIFRDVCEEKRLKGYKSSHNTDTNVYSRKMQVLGVMW